MGSIRFWAGSQRQSCFANISLIIMTATQASAEVMSNTEPTSPSLDVDSSFLSNAPLDELADPGEGLDPAVGQKKKKKKKPRKSAAAKAKEAAARKTAEAEDAQGRQPTLCISRNKHWRYISSYHVRCPKFRTRFILIQDFRDHGSNCPLNCSSLCST